MVRIYSAEDTLKTTREVFWLDRKGKPELVPIGLRPLDNLLGGLTPGTCGILGLATGVGKSSTMLYSALKSTVPVGIVSLEDTPDMVGARIMSFFTKVDSLRLRTKDVSREELEAVKSVDPPSHIHFAYPLAGSIVDVEQAIEALTERGAKMIWVDYLQEIRGHRDERRQEVAEALSRCHRAAAKGGAVLMMLSQFHRLQDPHKPPQIWNLAESSDLEKKARIIVLGWVTPDPEGQERVRFKLAKSNYGGAGLKFDMVRDTSGTLRPAKFYDVTENM